jgi:hypothetical protein
MGAVVLVALAGCAPIWIGAGAVGGYAVGRDAIRNHFDVSESALYDISRDIIAEQGFVTEEEPRAGQVKGEVDGANVTVTIRPVSTRTVELTVRARNKFLMPRVSTAHLVYNRILDRLH